MSRSQDEIFFDTFMGVLAALVVFTILMGFLAGGIAKRTVAVSHFENKDIQAALAKRIAPVGDPLISGEPMPEPVAAPEPEPTTMAAAEPRSADTVYNLACVACHGMGIAGAPKVGDADAWAPRIAKGLDTLNGHAINGFNGDAGYMPAKGGNMTLTDDEVIAAVQLMLDQSQ